MSVQPRTTQAPNRIMESSASTSRLHTSQDNPRSLSEHQSSEHLRQTLSQELGRQERHLAWRLEVAYAMGDTDQVEDDVNMAFLTRIINHQLVDPFPMPVVSVSDFLGGIPYKRC